MDITRAREMARFARMDLERRRPNIYGQQTKLVHEAGEDLGKMLREARQRVTRTIEAEPIAQLPFPPIENTAK